MVADEPQAMSAKRARTRDNLLRATLELMATGGLHGISLDAVAKRAGVTKGAIYDNFESKDAMIVAALAATGGQGMEGFDWPRGHDGTVRERLRRLGRAVLVGAGMTEGRAAARAEFLLYALTHPDLRKRMIELSALGPTRGAENVLGLFREEELPMPPKAFAWMISSLVTGLTFNRIVAPAPPDDETVLAMFEGLVRPA
ncbi:MAG: TetR/AcrR family transcriptional regulator [Caulobacteraceae bacterium]